MKKYLLLTVGFKQPTPEQMEQWNAWFTNYGKSIIEQVGLMNGKEVTAESVTELEMNESAITGYLVVEMESLEQAVQMAKDCPAVTSTRVYEVR